MRRALVRVTHECLHKALGLPEDVKVIGVHQDSGDVGVGRFDLFIESPRFQDLPENSNLPPADLELLQAEGAAGRPLPPPSRPDGDQAGGKRTKGGGRKKKSSKKD